MNCYCYMITQKTKFMGPTWGPPGSCRPQMAPCWPHEPCYQGNCCWFWMIVLFIKSVLVSVPGAQCHAILNLQRHTSFLSYSNETAWWLRRLGFPMMTSSNRTIFRVTDLLCWEFTTNQFPSQRSVTRSFDVFFDLRLNQQLSQKWRRQ